MGILDYCKKISDDKKEIESKLEEYKDNKTNVVVDPHVITDYNLKNKINDNKFDFLVNFFLKNIKSVEDVESLIENIEDEKIKTTYKGECNLKIRNAYDAVFSSYLKSINNKITNDPSFVNPFKGLSSKDKIKKYDEIFKSDKDLQKQYEIEKLKHFKGVIISFIKNRPSDFELLFKKSINDQLEKDFENELKNNPPKEEIDDSRVLTNEEDIKEFKKLTNNEKDLETLDYIQNEILSELNKKGLSFYADNAEAYGKKCEQNLREVSVEGLNKDKRFDGVIKRDPNGRTSTQISFSNTNHNPIQVREDFSKMKPIFSDKTKDIMKKILLKLDKMERYTLPSKEKEPLFTLDKYLPEEGDPKVYGFIGLKDLSNKCKILLRDKTLNNLEELKKLAEFHKNMIKDYDELISLAKEFDSSSVMGNISSSRVAELPTRYIKDFENVSKINEMWHCLSSIKRANCTIDEFIEDPISIYKKNISDFKDLKFIDDMAKDKDPLELMHTFKGYDPKIKEMQDKLIQKSDVLRGINSIGHFEKENRENNAKIAELNHSLLECEARYAVFSVSKYFEEKSELQTLKNLIVCQDKTISKAKLTANPDFDKDIFTGKTVNDFDYNKYLDEREIDLSILANTLLDLKEKADTNKKYAEYKDIFKKAAKDIFADMITKKDLKNHKEYAAFLEASGISYESIVKAKKDTKPHKYVRNILNEFKNENNKEKTISRLIVAYKGLNDHYNKRSILSRIFNPNAWKERSAKNDIKEELIKQNISENDINDLLNGTIKASTLTNKFVDSLSLDNNIENINVPEAANEKEVTNLINNIQVEKDLENEIVIENDEDLIKNKRN